MILNSIKKTNTFIFNKQKTFFLISVAMIIFFIFSYMLMLSLSVFSIYAIDYKKNDLNKIQLSNSTLESEYSLQKESTFVSLNSDLIISRKVDYIDFSYEKFVFFSEPKPLR